MPRNFDNKPVAMGPAVLAVLALLATPAVLQAFEVFIDIAPRVLNIQSQGTVVTVHTDISYSAVEAFSVTLDGVAIISWKADARGNFVAKFLMDEIKGLEGLAIGEYNTLRLAGVAAGGEPFAGEAEILVIDVIPKGR